MLVCGVGINDLKGWSNHQKYSNKDFEFRAYSLWRRMIARCYNETFIKRCKTYQNVTVCERWKTLSNFVEDLPKIKNYELWLNHPLEGICLDKDTLEEGNTEYCLEKCTFLTKVESSRDVFERHKEELRTPEMKKKSHRMKEKAIICTYPDGTEKRFNSMSEAQRLEGFLNQHISKCCKGIRPTHKGCKFRYA